ncbi:hypothetical protein LguiB_028068 [Lonicera macranthoides]
MGPITRARARKFKEYLEVKNKSKIYEIEKIEVKAEEGELWVERVVPNLREEEDEEVILQIEEPQVQAHEDQMKLQKKSILKVEVQHVDFIGVNKYDSHPNHLPESFSNELKMIELKHGLKFDEFHLSKKAKQQTGRCGLNQAMHSEDSRTNLLDEEGYDMIRSSSNFYSTMVVHGIPNDDPHLMNYKDRAWNSKGIP